MAGDKKSVFSKDFNHADERRLMQSHGHIDVIQFGEGGVVGRAVFEPGWRWSNDVKPIAGTESCEEEHSGYLLKGTLAIRLDSGEEIRIKAGEAFYIPSGHDAWVEGNEAVEALDFTGAAHYAMSSGKKAA